MPRLKVLFLPVWYPSEVSSDPFGGIFIRERAKAVSQYNDITVMYAYRSPSLPGKKLYQITEDIEEGIRTIRIRHRHLPIPKMFYLLRLWSILTAFRKLIKEGWKADIIDAHVFSAGVPAIILGKLYKVPVVITEHCGTFQMHRLTFLERVIARFTMSKASIILPVSDDLRKAIQDYYGIKRRFCVVPNVVNTALFYPVAYKTEDTNKKRMLIVALLAPRKGIPYLMEALSQIKDRRQDFRLDVVGDGPNRKDYEELVTKLGLDDFVRFHGWRQPEEVASFMRRCDFFVLPSLHESFGVVYIEAMACGKPVIATSAGGCAEIVTDDAGILVPPRDVETLSDAIEFMLNNYSAYPPERLTQYARQNFSYQVVGKTLDRIYREVVGASSDNWRTKTVKESK